MPRHLNIPAAIRVHPDISKSSQQILVGFFSKRHPCLFLQRSSLFSPVSALRSASVSQSTIPVPSGPSRDSRPRLCPLPLTFPGALRSQWSEASSKEEEILSTSSYLATFSRLLHCLSRLEKRSQNTKPVLKAVLSKRGEAAPPTSPNLPAPWLFNSPPQPFAPRLRPF